VAQRDYILRLIEELGAVLVELRRRILARELVSGGAEDELAAVADKAGFDVAILRSLSIDSLHLFAAPSGEVDPTRCWLMAEILYLDGLQATIEEQTTHARTSLEKARVLYSLIAPGGGMLVGFDEAADRTEEIDRLLAGERPETEVTSHASAPRKKG
jgi:hypothetical protein